jgi:hypothetical protein
MRDGSLIMARRYESIQGRGTTLKRKRVGRVWHGNPLAVWPRDCSVTMGRLAPLFGLIT